MESWAVHAYDHLFPVFESNWVFASPALHAPAAAAAAAAAGMLTTRPFQLELHLICSGQLCLNPLFDHIVHLI